MRASEHLLDQIHPPAIPVLGCTLKPVCLGHLYTLRKLGISDLLTSPMDCVLATLVLTHGHKELSEKLQSRLFGWKLKIWVWRSMRWMKNPHNFLSTMKVLEKYIRTQTARPDHVNCEGTSDRFSETPFVQSLRIKLISKCNYNPDTVYETPFVQAIWDSMAVDEMNGLIEIRDGIDGSWESERQAEADAYDAKVKAEEAASCGS